jgi:hypothetical protein
MDRRLAACGVLFPVPPARGWWQLRRRLAVPLLYHRVAVLLPLLLAAAALVIGWHNFDRHYSKGLPGYEEGHRQRILFGLWQPGPRDRGSVEARFLKNIKKYGPNWGEPGWGGTAAGYDESTFAKPHNYRVMLDYCWNGRRYMVQAFALSADVSRDLTIRLSEVGPDGELRDVAEFSSPSRGKLVPEGTARERDSLWALTAATEIDDALRDAQESLRREIPGP